MRNAKSGLQALRLVVIAAITLFYVFPIVWVVSTAFKNRVDIFSMPPKLLFQPTLDNFRRVFVYVSPASGRVEMTQFARFFLNSAFLSFGSVALALVVGTFAAYGLSRFEFRNKDFVLFAILSTRMLPAVATVVPIYLFFRRFGLMNSYVGMIVLYSAFSVSFVVWMMKSFFDEIPREIEEAAQIDGSSRFRAFVKVSLPQVKAGVAATVVISVLYTWNEFLFALMLTGTATRTVPVALASALQGELGVDWGLLAAIETLYVLPVLVVVVSLQRYLLRGLTFGTVRK
jgi:multiple sugar transport system permease protein